ncbi:MAG: FtsX-like permease family protein [Frankiaceae bacterium]
MSRLPSLSVAVRLARRDALLHKGRSLLVMLMVALPVLGLTGADVLARTMQLSPMQKLDREIGRADARLQIVGGQVTQGADAATGTSSDGHEVAPGTPAYAALRRTALAALPPGSRAIDYETGTAIVRAGDRRAQVSSIGLDLRDPMTTGLAHLVRGRLPGGPDEASVSPHLADRFGLRVGSSVRLGEHDAVVVGLVASSSALRDDLVWTLPGGTGGTGGPVAQASYLLVASPRPITWTDVQRFDAMGVAVTSRAVVADPPPGADPSPRSVDSMVMGIATVAVGLGVLEVMLLAGAAFAVGARRQRRELALLAAAGGDPAQVRQVVLAGGGVLGAAGALLGVAVGVVTGVLARPALERLSDRLAGPLDIRPVELLAIAAVGLATGVLAAVLPARTAARDDVVAALTGRRGTVATRRRVPMTGLGMVALGSLLAAYAAHPPARFTLILVGAVMAELGFVVCAPALVGAAGRLAGHLPLAPRLALRDAARHRSRTGPAVAAIMAAIAGSVAVSTYITSTVERERQNYQPLALMGQALVQVSAGSDAPSADTVLAIARRDAGATGIVALATLDCFSETCTTVDILTPPDSSCPQGCVTSGRAPAVGDARTVAALAGRTDAGAAAALARGTVVVLAPGAVRGGQITVELSSAGDTGAPRQVRLPAYQARAAAGTPVTDAVLPAAVASSLGLAPSTHAYLLRTDRTPSQAQVDRANADLAGGGDVYVERGYHPERWAYGLIALAVGAALVTLGATAVTTGLSAAELRPDLATLAAVGGAPRTRRALAASQAGTIAGLGAGLGVVAGVIPAWAILTANHAMPVALPWATIAALVIGLPIVVTVATGALTRARLPGERRLG